MTDTTIVIIGVLFSLLAGCILIYRRRKNKLSVSASIVMNPINEGSVTKGTMVRDAKGMLYEILLNIKIENNTDSNLDISSIFIEYEFENSMNCEFQIIPDEFPISIDKLDSIETNIQKEWIDYENINSLGVIDLDGKHYSIPRYEIDKIWLQSNDMPSSKIKYDKKQGPQDVTMTFVVKDRFKVKSPLELWKNRNMWYTISVCIYRVHSVKSGVINYEK